VVITNPTHYAVAIKYDPKEADAPVVVAKDRIIWPENKGNSKRA